MVEDKNITFKDSREASNYATWIWINFKMKIYPVSNRKQVSRVKCTPVKGGTSTCYRGYYESKIISYKKDYLVKTLGS